MSRRRLEVPRESVDVYLEHNSRVALSRMREARYGIETKDGGYRHRNGTEVTLVSRDSHSFAVLCKSPSNLDPFKLAIQHIVILRKMHQCRKEW